MGERAPLGEDERADLGRLLSSHRAVDADERAHLERIRAFAAREADPFDRALRDAHLTGSAFVLDPAGRLLLTHHRRLGIWVQVGGHADSDRRAHEVALREAREESGLPDLAFHRELVFSDGAPRLLDVDVHRIPAARGEQEHLHLDLRFVLVTASPSALVACPAESKALEWVSLDAARLRCTPDLHRAIGKLEGLRRISA